MKRTTLALVLVTAPCFAQTTVDLGLQGKDPNFAAMPHTKPIQTGSTLPSTCQPGDFFLNSANLTGQNLYACVGSGASGSWSLIGASTLEVPYTGATSNLSLGTFSVSAGSVVTGNGEVSPAVVFPELSGNGSNATRMYGADNQSASGCFVLPTGTSAAGDTMVDSGVTETTSDGHVCRVLAWTLASAGSLSAGYGMAVAGGTISLSPANGAATRPLAQSGVDLFYPSQSGSGTTYTAVPETKPLTVTAVSQTASAVLTTTGPSPAGLIGIGSTVWVVNAAGSGCSGLNGAQTVTAVGTNSLTVSFNSTSCTYTVSSGTVAVLGACPTALSPGMLIQWLPDVNGTGGATTLNICGLGATTVTEADGVTSPTATDVATGKTPYQLYFDGAVFRLPAGGSGSAVAWGTGYGHWCPWGCASNGTQAFAISGANGAAYCFEFTAPWTMAANRFALFTYGSSSNHVSYALYNAATNALFGSTTATMASGVGTVATWSGANLGAAATYYLCLSSDATGGDQFVYGTDAGMFGVNNDMIGGNRVAFTSPAATVTWASGVPTWPASMSSWTKNAPIPHGPTFEFWHN